MTSASLVDERRSPPIAVITVHGVGDTDPGRTVDPIARRISRLVRIPYARDDIVVDGVTYVRLAPQRDGAPELIEVNWADLQRPHRSVTGFLVHLVKLLFALLEFADRWERGDGSRLLSIRAYRLVLLALGLWVAFPPLLALAGMGLEDWRARLIFMLIALAGAGACLVAAVLWARDVLVPSVLWVVAIMGLAGVLLSTDVAADARVVTWTTWPYALVQLALGGLLAVVLIELAVRWALGRLPFQVAVARLGACLVPFMVLTAVGSCVWAGSLAAVARTNGGSIPVAWDAAYRGAVPYDLASVELAMTVAVGGAGVLALLVALTYGLGRIVHRGALRSAGRIAQHGMLAVLVIAPLLLLIPGIAIVSDLVGGGVVNERSVVDIYTTSAMRIVPFLPAVLPGMVIVLDIIGDVVFYGISNRGLTIRKLAQRRLRVLLNYYSERGWDVCILSHSQGTVIATDLVGRRRRDATRMILFTMGSPLQTLYERFLGDAVPALGHVAKWINLYRDGDYIGGSVDAATDNANLGPGGHSNYWSDPRTIRKLLEAIAPR